MPERDKAIFHAVLVMVGVLEALSTKNKWRSLLIGVCTGWHCYATYEHIRDMRREHGKKLS